MHHAIINADCLEAMRLMPDGYFHAVVTDPPYGLSKEPDMVEVLRHWLAGEEYEHKGSGFMSAQWDSFVPGPPVWREVFRVLEPGGNLLDPFAGSGSTLCAAAFEDIGHAVGIEQSAEYVGIAEARVEYWVKAAWRASAQLSLFDHMVDVNEKVTL